MSPAVSSATSTSTGFYSQKLWRLQFLVLEPWVGWSGLGPGSLRYLPNFYPPHVDVGPPVLCLCTTLHTPALHTSLCLSVSLALLLIWLDVVYLNCWLSGFHMAQFSDIYK